MHLLDEHVGKTIQSFAFSGDPQFTSPELAIIRFTDGTSVTIRLETFGPEGFQKIVISPDDASKFFGLDEG